MTSLFDEIAAEAEEVRSAPSDEKLRSVALKASELVQLDAEADELERLLKDVRERSNVIRHKDLPDLMMELDLGEFSLASAGVRIKVESFAKAGISAEWDDERREAAFEHLEEIGGADLIKATLTVSAARGDLERIREMQQTVTDILHQRGVQATVSVGMSVHWKTLSTFVKEVVEKGDKIDLEKLGATVGNVAKIRKA